MIQYCDANGIACEITGKVIVATSEKELDGLEALAEHGRKNGVQVRKISPSELAEIEPNAAGIAALHVPEAGIVDFGAVTRALQSGITNRGAEVRTSAKVISMVETDREVQVELSGGDTLVADLVVTCGGLHADRLAMHTNPELKERILAFRGEYFELAPDRRHLVNGLIYPVPDPRFPFLGVHLTRMIDGSIHAGPNAVLALAREGYRWTSFSLGDMFEVAQFGGWWRLAARHWPTGIGEVARSMSKRAFARSLRRLVPELTASDLVRAPAGVRAQAVAPSGDLLDDFVWSETQRVVSLINAPSPAATASLAIGHRIAAQALDHFN